MGKEKVTVESHTKAAVEFSFKRGKRIGVNMFNLEPGVPLFAEIKKFDVFKSEKYPDGIEYFDFVNLQTGEEQRMWVDGGLRGALHDVGGPSKAVGMKLEIVKGEQKTIEIMNDKTGKLEKVKVNTYEVFQGDTN